MAKIKKPLARPFAGNKSGSHKFKPRAGSQLSAVLKSIGAPAAAPFIPDPFQIQAAEKIKFCDVLVSAPTGSGKTWIARQAIEHFFNLGQRVWYASPLKALSNAKFSEFGEKFGADNVGILTGDRKENTSAPLIVGTTEILRNQLYDAMSEGQDLPLGLVILDEAHYLGDPDRGVVWEETMVYLPSRIRLLLLSATIANEEELAAWLGHIRQQPLQIIRELQRPVPLVPLALLPDGLLLPLQDKNRGLSAKLRAFIKSNPRPDPPAGENTLSALEEFNLLPAIFFLKSRADCENLLLASSRAARLTISAQQSMALEEVVGDFLARFPFLRAQAGLDILRHRHLAAHHAGLLPHWKLLVEALMQRGLLKAIFSTSTMAAGVNFPARSVIISQSDRFTGQEFTALGAGDLAQMTGRAGRRGMDKVGFGILLPGPFQDLPFMARLFSTPPEPVQSQLRINFSMVLNLLLSHRPADVREMLTLSLAAWQKNKGSVSEETPAMGTLRASLSQSQARCASGEEIYLRGRLYRLLLEDQAVLASQARRAAAALGLEHALARGRRIQSGKMLPFVVLRSQIAGGNPGVSALRLLPERRLLRGHPQIDFIPLDEIYKVYDQKFKLPNSDHPRALAGWFRNHEAELADEEIKPLSQRQLAGLGLKAKEELKRRTEKLARMEADFICSFCAFRQTCANPRAPLVRQAEQAAPAAASQDNAWGQFIRHLEFLRSEGFVDQDDRLSGDGLWASSLRLNQPVLIAESIRRQTLPDHDPPMLAALLALFVDNRESRDSGGHPLRIDAALARAAEKVGAALHPVLERLDYFGFETPLLPINSAQAVYAWAQMAELEPVSQIYGGGEGDVAQLIYRVADNLRQLADLRDTHPRLAASAAAAVDLLLRPPILLPV